MGLGPGIDFLIAFAAPQIRHQQALKLVQLADFLGGDDHGNFPGVLGDGTGREAFFGCHRLPRYLPAADQKQGRGQGRNRNRKK